LLKYQEKKYGTKMQKMIYPKQSSTAELNKLVSSLSFAEKKALADMLKQEDEEEKSVKGKTFF